MVLNDWGMLFEEQIQLSTEKRPDWIFHQWVIMPNHLNFLIEIVNTNGGIVVDTHRSTYLQQQKKQK